MAERRATHCSVVVLVDANEVILQDLHLSAYPGVDESASEHLQLHGILCSDDRCNQTADEDLQKQRASDINLHETQTILLQRTFKQAFGD